MRSLGMVRLLYALSCLFQPAFLMIPGTNTLFPDTRYREILQEEIEDLGISPEQMADKLLALINRERLRKGYSELKRDEHLVDTAREHNRKMAAENILDHHFPDYPSLGQRLAEKEIFFSMCAENVSSSETFLTRLIHGGLMESPPHSRNILNDRFTHCGIHVLLKGRVYYITQHFTRIIICTDNGSAEKFIAKEISRRIHISGLKPVSPIPEMNDLLRNISKSRLNPSSGKPELPDLGHSVYLNLSGPELEDMIREITSEIQRKGYDSYGIGIAFERNAGFPGGTFSVSLVFYPETEARTGRLERNKEELLAHINRIRKSVALPLLIEDKELNSIASKLSADPDNRNSTRLDLSGKRKILIASGERIEQIKDLLTRLAKTNLNARRIGVSIAIPEINGVPVNYFVAAIII